MVIIISGATCVGKSNVALKLSEKINGEIINADSMQVYKYFDIGTAKPKENELKAVKHHLIDILNPDEDFSAGEFSIRAKEIISNLKNKKKVPVIVGGTGLYIKTLTEGYVCGVKSEVKIRERLEADYDKKGSEKLYKELFDIDPEYAKKIFCDDKLRIIRALEVYYISKKTFSSFLNQEKAKQFDFKHVILERDRAELYNRINSRVVDMFSNGIVKEVEKVIKMGYSTGLKPFKSIGYKQVILNMKGEITLQKAVYETKKETRHYAKRQLTWFRKIKEAEKIFIKSDDKIEDIIEKVYTICKFKVNI